MRLSDLIGMDGEKTWPAIDIAGLTADSREVHPGYLFAALVGSRVDGRAFIADAVRHGAAAVLAPTGTVLPADALPGDTRCLLIEDDNPRRRFARMAGAFYGRQPAVIAAVTGTNGKTSSVQFTRQIWEKLGHQAAALGTLGVTAPRKSMVGAMTTPDPVRLHATLADLAAAGIDHVAMEASSHGLDQFRLDGVRLAAAAFTNLSRDHLDYHGSMEAYFRAKAGLFERVLPAGGGAVVNADQPEYDAIAAIVRARGQRLYAYGTEGKDIRVLSATALPDGQAMELEVEGHRYTVRMGLVGRFQGWNALCALGLALACGADRDKAVAALETLDRVRGRMELVARHPNGATVYVDFAHSPDGLVTVLTALRPHTRGRLVVVFGAGGDRDRGKRPLMGDICRRLADHAIVTDDNPRGEDPAAIRREVLVGCPDAQEIGDRAEAIRAAVAGLGPDDVLVIAGKGHEQGQIVGDQVRPFDDAEEARRAVAEVVP